MQRLLRIASSPNAGLWNRKLRSVSDAEPFTHPEQHRCRPVEQKAEQCFWRRSFPNMNPRVIGTEGLPIRSIAHHEPTTRLHKWGYPRKKLYTHLIGTEYE